MRVPSALRKDSGCECGFLHAMVESVVLRVYYVLL